MSRPGQRARVLAEARSGVARAANFSGWVFDVDATHLDPPAPWDYEAIAREQASRAARVLDLGTGGGERLSEVIAGLPCRAVATEEWHVNAPIAARRLAPLGVDVVRCSSLRLPFAGASFDLVLDRHEALDPAEAARVLAPGGAVITQQVGGDNWPELGRFFPRKTDFGDHFHGYQRGFAAAGLSIDDARWHEERVAFGGIAHVAYMLALTPWFVADFDPEGDLDALLALEDACGTPDGVVLTEMRYIIRAHRPS
ncbi:MAG: class I SAM-dependent methyltransferase [Dehalococcoidia bacterium]